MARLFTMLAGMENKMDTNAQQMEGLNKKMDANVQTLRGEMQQMGRGLQAGIMAIARSETRAVELMMAAPRGDTNELRGSATAVRPAMETDQIIWETCWARVVTEQVTVTEREKLNGMTETCTRRVETREITNAVTEIKCTETREIEGELDGVKEDEHTHTRR